MLVHMTEIGIKNYVNLKWYRNEMKVQNIKNALVSVLFHNKQFDSQLE
jgi:hypothetical protein